MKIKLQNVNTNKLHDELIASGIIPLLVESQDNTTWVTVNETDVVGVNTVVASHNPTPIIKPDPDVELYNAINAATDIPTLKAALLGINGGKKAKIVGKLK